MSDAKKVWNISFQSFLRPSHIFLKMEDCSDFLPLNQKKNLQACWTRKNDEDDDVDDDDDGVDVTATDCGSSGSPD